jgi:hypothetical protein
MSIIFNLQFEIYNKGMQFSIYNLKFEINKGLSFNEN